jgi:ligand-binding sensor domain-containing protein
MKFALFLTLFITAYTVQAQNPAYNQYTTKDGLSGNTVYCGVQDKKGFLWFGTNQGLSRFDGTRFEHFGVKEGLPDPEVLELFSSSDGDLWISCFKKNLSIRKNGHIQIAVEDNLLAKISLKSAIFTFHEDRLGKKWICGKDRSLFIINQDSIIRINCPTNVFSVFEMDGDLFAIRTDGLYRMSLNGDLLQNIILDQPTQNPFTVLTNAVVTGDKLIVMSPHLMMFQRQGDRFQFIEEHKDLFGKLFVDSQGRCWVGTSNKGAICFVPPYNSLSNYISFIPGKRVNSIIEDIQGGFWFGTIGEGVFRLGPNGSTIYNLSSDHTPTNITALSTATGGGILSGDDKGFLHHISKEGVKKIPLPGIEKYNKCRQIKHIAPYDYWIGSDLGLYHYQKGKVTLTTNLSAIKAIEYRKDTLWMGMATSIYFLTPNATAAIRTKAERATALCQDSEGILWEGGTNGLKCEQQAFQFNWGERFSELGNRVLALENGGQGVLWVVTPQHGLIRLLVKNGAVLSLKLMDYCFKGGIRNIQSLFQEASGKLWIATNEGIYTLDKEYKTQYFGLQDGLANLDVNCVLVANDTLWVGTVAGVTCRPLSTIKKVSTSPIFFAVLRYRVAEKNIRMSLLDTLLDVPVLYLPSNANAVELDLSVQDYNSDYNKNFECTIIRQFPAWYNVTFDHLLGWIRAGFRAPQESSMAERGVLQMGLNLPTGRYLISASTSNKGGNTIFEPNYFILEKDTPWYGTALFWCICWALIIVALYRIIRAGNQYRIIQTQLAELKIQALQAQINPHFIGNSINAIQQFFYPPNAAKASIYIAIFTRLLRKTMEFSEHHFIPFHEEVLYVNDYLEMVQLRFEDRFKYTVSNSPNIPPDLLFPSMLLQPLLENATIHGLNQDGETLIEVGFNMVGNRLRCQITDNGIGIEKAKQTKITLNPQHKSKGMELLFKKIQTLNILYHHDIDLTVNDRNNEQPAQAGTRAMVSFSLLNQSQLPKIDDDKN